MSLHIGVEMLKFHQQSWAGEGGVEELRKIDLNTIIQVFLNVKHIYTS